MSRDKQLQEMEVGTKQSKTAVNAGAKAADPMPSLSGATPGQTGSWEDLGGPTPENYKSDDDSAKLKTGEGLKQVKDVVNKGAKPAEAMKGMKEEEELEDEDLIEEEEEVVAEEEISEEEVTEEEVVAEAPDYTEIDIEEDVNALLGEEELSEEFREKARTIFEAALVSKVSQIKEELEEKYETALAEEVAEIKEALTERVDSYLEYVSQEWIKENALAVESGLKEELTSSFMTGLKGLFEDHYVSIPEDKLMCLRAW